MDMARAPLRLSGSPLAIQGGILQAARLTLLGVRLAPWLCVPAFRRVCRFRRTTRNYWYRLQGR